MKNRSQIPFGDNVYCVLTADTNDDGSVTLKDINGYPLLTLGVGNGIYRLRVENIFDFTWTEEARDMIEDLEALVIREVLEGLKGDTYKETLDKIEYLCRYLRSR